MLLYALTILVSAFLLFQIEPIIAKAILPWFGGSANVWTTCLLFFQIVLLLGYLYAHAVVRYLRPKAQVALHASPGVPLSAPWSHCSTARYTYPSPQTLSVQSFLHASLLLRLPNML